MSGLDEMLKVIRESAEAEAGALLDQARLEAARVEKEAREAVDAECARIAEGAKAEVEAMHARAQSESDIANRRAVLLEKQRAIGALLEDALLELRSLSVDRYFPLLVEMAAKNAEVGEGVMFLSAKDLGRMPSGFERSLQSALPAGAGLAVSKDPRETGGGFILQYGSIDKNCAFPALFAEKREALTDAAAKALFG